MTTLPFDAHLPLYGVPGKLYVACDLTVDVVDECDEPVMWVVGIKTEGVALPAKVYEPGTLEAHLAKRIVEAAYADEDFEAQAFDAFGWTRTPDGHWRRPEPDPDQAREFREAAE